MKNIKDNINYKLTSLFIRYFKRRGYYKKLFIILTTRNYYKYIGILIDLTIIVEKHLILQYSLFSILKYLNDHNICYDNISTFNFDDFNTELDLKQHILSTTDYTLFEKEYTLKNHSMSTIRSLVGYLAGRGIL